MWWVGSERLTIYLGTSSVAVQRNGAAETEWQQIDAAASGFEQAVQAFARQRRSKRSCLLDIQLSGALARPFVLDAVQGLRNLREATELATSIAPDSTGLQGPCVVWLDDWMPARQCIAVAMDSSLRDQLEASAALGGLRVDAMRPWWSLAIDAARSKLDESPRLLAIEDTDSLTVLDSAQPGRVSASTHTPRLDPVPLRATLARAALAADLQSSDILFAAMPGPKPNSARAEGDKRQHGLVPMVERWT